MILEEFKKKLSQIIDFRIARGAQKEFLIEENKLLDTPATDGKKIYLPESYPFSQDWFAYVVRHEADHIREFSRFSKTSDRTDKSEAVKEYIEGFLEKPEFEENPALAFEIFNVVEDGRIDTKARDELPGAWEIFEKEKPRLMERNKKIISPKWPTFSELDKFRQWFIERNFLGETVEEVSEIWKSLLAECVECAHQVYGKSLSVSLEATEKIYQKFKENFDIKPKLKKLPQLAGRGKPIQGVKVPPNKAGGIQTTGEKDKGKREIKKGKSEPGQGKSQKKDRKQKAKQKKDKLKQKREPKYGKPSAGKSPWLNEDRDVLNPTLAQVEGKGNIGEMINRYAGEIERTIKVLRFLRKEAMIPRKSREGQEVDLQDYIQAELKKEATGVTPDDPMFVMERKHKPNPGWSVLLDVSSSTSDIIDQIKATAIILGEALKRSDYQFGLFAFNSDSYGADTLYQLKRLEEKYSENSVKKILALRSKGWTGMADSLSSLAKDLIKLRCRPKGIIVVTDGEPNRLPPVQKILKEFHQKRIFSIFVCIGIHIPAIKQIVKEYIRIGTAQMDKLPAELLRIFRVYRL